MIHLDETILDDLTSLAFKAECFLKEGHPIRTSLYRIRCQIGDLKKLNRQTKDKKQGWVYEDNETPAHGSASAQKDAH